MQKDTRIHVPCPAGSLRGGGKIKHEQSRSLCKRSALKVLLRVRQSVSKDPERLGPPPPLNSIRYTAVLRVQDLCFTPETVVATKIESQTQGDYHHTSRSALQGGR